MLTPETSRYARCIVASKKIRWDIDADVLRGRVLDASRDFMPSGLSLADDLPFLTPAQRRLFSQVQGRTYANLFGLVERFVNAKVLEVSREHWFGDQVALEALVRFSEEELKHQELFRRVEQLAAAVMPPGYTVAADANAVAGLVLGKSTWAVLALICHIELFTLVHYKKSIAAADLCGLWKDVFLFHWKEESQHAQLDELEWRRADATLSPGDRDRAVTELIELVTAVDGLLQAQAAADGDYFIAHAALAKPHHERAIREVMLKAYRWQYIISGVQEGTFVALLDSMVSEPQRDRVAAAIGALS